jgi:beta-alanine degradation protein BauB
MMSSSDSAAHRVLGPIGDKVIFENEHVRVWSLSLDSGQTQPWHRHDLPYLVIPITAGNNVMHFADGRTKPTEETPGDALWREPGIAHELHNVSGWQYRNVLVEIKTVAANASAPEKK